MSSLLFVIFMKTSVKKIIIEMELKVLTTLFNDKTETGDQFASLKNPPVSQSSSANLDQDCLSSISTSHATNSTSKRSFSALKRIKTYIRSTMTQARLNHLMVLYYHQEFTDTLDLKLVGNDFIIAKDTRQSAIAKI